MISISTFFGFTAFLFALFGAILKIVENSSSQNFEGLRLFFKKSWILIDESPFRSLPTNIIRQLIYPKFLFNNRLTRFIESNDFIPLFYLFIHPTTLILHFVVWGFSFYSVLAGLIFVLVFAVYHWFHLNHKPIEEYLLKIPPGLIFIMLFMITGLYSTFLIIKLTISLSFIWSTVLIILIAPPIWIWHFRFFVSEIYPTFHDGPSMINYYSFMGLIKPMIGLFVAGSFSLTFLSFLIGHILYPLDHIPRTWQMLISNFFSDGLTLIFTYALLKKSLNFRKVLLPLFILLDLFIATILAIFSLFFGLLYTEESLTILEVFNVLIAKSPEGKLLHFGVYFWVMHTAFIPTLFFLSVIMTGWICKIVLECLKWFFHKGYLPKNNPFQLTIAVCGLFAVIFSYLAVVF
ncbi:hypothetical protein KFE98_17745 [bacterium SCSIO 12741]|nr:hypothetical protein KFE98_17745 [bacterium SCSIO 12741]